MATLTTVLQDIGSILNQDTTLPTGTDLSVQISLINQAQNEWGEAYEFKQLRVPSYALPFSLSATSIALPNNFEKLMGKVYDVSLPPSTYQSNEYTEIRPEDRFNKGINDRYVWVGGNDVNGWFININPALVSGASMVLDYQSTPSSLATYSDSLTCPSKNFIVKRVLAKIYQSRSDPRFPAFQDEANDAMIQMIQEESAVSGGMDNVLPTYYQKKNFVLGS